ncbi:radical SAM protein [Magnetospirillum sp. UT-4]|uniref:B12-binding domain-containing radical SAM protein n=1 Tax=Magnetospirillum sp. UT-4 TaxID=2681467 RepID=UPI0013811835|nr:radical SAM protein [Magnetospirillum sp. UT-4]CAA7618443.1 hypothetical protein MTBUT4_30063 [Magnetospirillum sp. UT-4]
MKVGFIFPSSDYLHDPFRGDPHTHYQILTVLDDHFGERITTSLIDLRGIKKEFALYHIEPCDVYLQSVYTLDYEEQVSLVKGLRALFPEAIHIAGGPHATVYQEECLKHFDALVLGDGEKSIIQALEDLRDGKLRQTYRMDVRIDINDYPVPRRHWLPVQATARPNMVTLKNKPGYDKLLGTTVNLSRGCPSKCSFCAMTSIREEGSPGLRYRDPHWVEAELEYLKKDFGIQGISLTDEIGIPLSMRRAVPHLEAIGRTGIVWRGQSRCDAVKPEVIKLAKESGCVALGMGVESVSQVSLDLIRKDLDIETAKRAIGILKDFDIEPRVYMIIGLPGEPPDIVERTWRFIEETEPSLVYLSLFTVRPGTEVFDNPKRFGIRAIQTDWRKTMHMYGRYDDEIPSLTFEYERDAPWGRAFSNREIVDNYLELQARLRNKGLASLTPHYVGADDKDAQVGSL